MEQVKFFLGVLTALDSLVKELKGVMEPKPEFKPEVEDNPLIFRFNSRSRKGLIHDVRITGKGLVCDCEGFAHRGHCFHVSVVSHDLGFNRIIAGQTAKTRTGWALCLDCEFLHREISNEKDAKLCRMPTHACPPLCYCHMYIARGTFAGNTERNETIETAWRERKRGKIYPVLHSIEEKPPIDYDTRKLEILLGEPIQRFVSKRSGEPYYVTQNKNTGLLECTCKGNIYHGHCKHVTYLKEHGSYITL